MVFTKNNKIVVLNTLILIILSIYLYQYNINLYLIFLLFPIFLYQDLILRFPDFASKEIRSLYLAVCILFLPTVYAIVGPQNLREVSLLSHAADVLIVSWINFVTCFLFFFQIKSTKINGNLIYTILAFLISIFTTISYWEKYFSTYFFNYPVILLAQLTYTVFIVLIFRKNEGIYFNFIMSLSMILTHALAFLSYFLLAPVLVFFLDNFYNVSSSFKWPDSVIFGTGRFSYLIFFQMTTVSSILLYILPQKYFGKYNNKIVRLMFFVFLSLGILLSV